ncbi:MAG: NAD(P)-dependent oxidoreductase [Candidatus Thermoplasmatota archaeon]|nr:NAD(P)-dependent oxidoreductase [Candidatus Thermoplasmatota archaeon]
MKILILGGSGQLAKSIGYLINGAIFASRSGDIKLDLTRNETIYDRLSDLNPDIIVNTSGMTGVDQCEQNIREAYLVNALSVKEIARFCRDRGIRLMHFSTDYVFDGKDGRYKEDSVPNPINYYGLSKLIGDSYALSYDNSIVIRTSGVYGLSRNFPVLSLEKLRSNSSVSAIRGYYSPIFAGLLARASVELMNSNHSGLLNIAGERVTRRELAIKIAERFGLDKNLVKEVMEGLNLVAKRPLDSSLDSSKARGLLSFDFYTSEMNVNEFYSFVNRK